MEIMESIKMSTATLHENERYRELVPRLGEKDYKLLKYWIELHGLYPELPIVVNQELVVLDGHTRLQVAKELGLEWVWVMVREFENHIAEQEYILTVNIVRRQHGYRRHLNTAQRAQIGLKLLKIRDKGYLERK